MTEETNRSDQMKKEEKFLKKAEREICKGAKNVYFKCLKSNDSDETKCTFERKGLEDVCPPSWVYYYDRQIQIRKDKENSKEYQEIARKVRG